MCMVCSSTRRDQPNCCRIMHQVTFLDDDVLLKSMNIRNYHMFHHIPLPYNVYKNNQYHFVEGEISLKETSLEGKRVSV